MRVLPFLRLLLRMSPCLDENELKPMMDALKKKKHDNNI